MGDRVADLTVAASFDLIDQSQEMFFIRKARTRFTYATSEYNKRIHIASISSCAGIGNSPTFVLCPPPSVILSEAKNLFLRNKDIHHGLIIRLLPRLTLSINRRKCFLYVKRVRALRMPHLNTTKGFT
jgi:hypothetical protein